MHFKPITWAVAVAMILFAATAPVSAAEKATNNNVVKDGMQVSIEYTLKGTDGKVIDTSKGREPLKYVHGQKMMIPGLEKQLTGMKVGGEKNVTVKPEDAYGPLNPNAVQEIAKEKIPPNALKVGAVLQGQDEQGRPMLARIKEIKEKSVLIDMNHPMAGKTLVFNIKIVDIQPAPPPTAPPPTAPAAKSTAPAKPAEPAKAATPAPTTKPAEPAKK
jgi:FKBP-type peptidyl-prolyl cis-trans isomerase SlyD